MHLANQRPGKPDKLSQGAQKQTSYPRVQWGNTLDKRETTDPGGQQMSESQGVGETSRDRGEHKVKQQSGL